LAVLSRYNETWVEDDVLTFTEYAVAATSKTEANWNRYQPAPPLPLGTFDKSDTFIASSVPVTVAPAWSNATVIVPVDPSLAPSLTAMPSMVIAPGVNVELATYDVVIVVSAASESNSAVASHKSHVEDAVKFPVALLINVAIIVLSLQSSAHQEKSS
jgi:hypothetical protein